MQYVFFFLLGSIAVSLMIIASKLSLIAFSVDRIYMCHKFSRWVEHISTQDPKSDDKEDDEDD